MEAQINSTIDFGFQKELEFNVVIITGACRTGKTTLARNLAMLSDYDFIDEPWLGMFLPVLLYMKIIPQTLAKSMLTTYFNELCNDVILYRRANFRPNDQSSLWSYKNVQDIFDRLINISTRNDVKNIVNSGKKVVICLPETTPFINFFLSLSKNIYIIHISREKNNVVKEIVEKEWFNDKQLLDPVNNQPYYKAKYNCKTWFIPWWVPENNINGFILSNSYNRSCDYYDFFHDAFYKQDILLKSNNNRLENISFESFMHNTKKQIDETNSKIKEYFQSLDKIMAQTRKEWIQ